MVMSTIGKVVLFFVVLMSNTSCNTIYTEKQTEALSRVVYATKDSLDAARIDLADNYSTEAIKIVKPPKQRIEIKTIYEKTSAVVTSTSSGTKQRVIVIPSKYKNDTVIVVSSTEYETLLKDKEVFEQFKLDQEVLIKAKAEVDMELLKQSEYRDQMVKDLNNMQKIIAEKNLSLLKCKTLILGLTIAIIGGIYLRMKGIL